MQFQLSVGERTLNPAALTYFKNRSITTGGDLKHYLIAHSYSLLTWGIDREREGCEYNRRRHSNNFESASGIVADIDGGLTIAKAIERLREYQLNYAIITSKSHRKAKGNAPPSDRFHILLFFGQPVTDADTYSMCFYQLMQLFPEMDMAVKDTARFLFPSPEDAEYYAWWDGDWFPADATVGRFAESPVETTFRPTSNLSRGHNNPLSPPPASGMEHLLRGTMAHGNEQTNKRNPPQEGTNEQTIHPDQPVTLATGEVKKIIDLEGKHPCRCIREEHTDEHPSAFVHYIAEKDRHFFSCSGCNYSGWCAVTTFEYGLEAKLDGFYIYGTNIVEFGLKHDAFYEHNIRDDVFFVNIGAHTADERKKAFAYLVKNRRLQHLASIDYEANPLIDESRFAVNVQSGIVEVQIAPLKEFIADNAFIEQYLERTFGVYTPFIKAYLAMYAYSNFIHLPTLVLYGARGTSKSTFANMVAAMYPSLYMDWSGSVASFTPEAEKKLLIVEENISDDKAQYKMLKKYTGQPYLWVNKKYRPEYKVRNNLNLILLSNEHIPLYVEKTEMPADENNNQFFVYEFPNLEDAPDAFFQQKLRERLGHYLRTELRQVFSSISSDFTRYGIPVPITEYEKRLFDNNTTNIEAAATHILEKIENNIPPTPREDYLTEAYRDGMELFKNGYLSVALLSEYTTKEFHANTIIKNLKKRGVIGEEIERVRLKSRRYTCYSIVREDGGQQILPSLAA